MVRRACPIVDNGPVSRRLATAAVVLALVVTGCSSSGGTPASPTVTSPTDATTTTAPEPASPGCGQDPDIPPVGSESPIGAEATLAVGGVERTYRLGVPADYDPDEPTPLVVNLHGSGSDAVQASVYGGFTAAAAERGVLTVTPDAIDGVWGLGAHDADHEFIDALVTDVQSRYCVDGDRIHLIGMSLGAWKAAVTACASPDTFAALALVTVEVHPSDCPAIPMIAFHGTADRTVPYGEGSPHEFPDSPNAGLPGTRENVAAWASGNGCAPEPTRQSVGEDVERWTYTGCTADVELYTIFEGGHTWPGADIEIGPTTRTIDATELALDWFASHARPG